MLTARPVGFSDPLRARLLVGENSPSMNTFCLRENDREIRGSVAIHYYTATQFVLRRVLRQLSDIIQTLQCLGSSQCGEVTDATM